MTNISLSGWTQSIGKQNGIIVVIFCSNNTNGIRGRKDKLIMYCKRGGDYKKKNSSQGIFAMKVKCPLY